MGLKQINVVTAKFISSKKIIFSAQLVTFRNTKGY